MGMMVVRTFTYERQIEEQIVAPDTLGRFMFHKHDDGRVEISIDTRTPVDGSPHPHLIRVEILP